MTDAKIVERIVEEARAKGEEVLRQAQEVHDKEVQEELGRLELEIKERRQREQRHAEEGSQQRLSAARLGERKKLLALKRTLLDQVYSAAWDKLVAADSYRSFLDRQLRAHTRQGDQIIVATTEVNRFQTELKPLLDQYGVGLAQDAGRFRAGFIITRGEARLNCTLDQHFRDRQGDSEIQAGKQLFSTED